jgi:hypothetical protein
MFNIKKELVENDIRPILDLVNLGIDVRNLNATLEGKRETSVSSMLFR